MANAYKLFEICKTCGGDGIDKSDGTVCKTCAGEKVVLVGYCSEAIFNIPELD